MHCSCVQYMYARVTPLWFPACHLININFTTHIVCILVYTVANVVTWTIESSRDWNVKQLVGVTQSTYLVQQLNILSEPSHTLAMRIYNITLILLLVLFLLSDAKLVPMMSEQVMEKPDTNTADTSYDTSSVVSTSISSQITKVIKAQEILVKLQ